MEEMVWSHNEQCSKKGKKRERYLGYILLVTGERSVSRFNFSWNSSYDDDCAQFGRRMGANGRFLRVFLKLSRFAASGWENFKKDGGGFSKCWYSLTFKSWITYSSITDSTNMVWIWQLISPTIFLWSFMKEIIVMHEISVSYTHLTLPTIHLV